MFAMAIASTQISISSNHTAQSGAPIRAGQGLTGFALSSYVWGCVSAVIGEYTGVIHE